MFIGEYKHSLDEKGRVAIPVKFRPNFRGGIVVSRGLDHCLFVFEKKEWEVFAGKIKALPISQSNPRAFSRLMLGGAMELGLDAQGRVLLPDYLRDYAGLSKQAVIVGLYDRLEMWDEERWKEYKARTEASGDDIAEKLGELGI